LNYGRSDWGVVTSEEEIDYVASFDTDFDGIVDRVAE